MAVSDHSSRALLDGALPLVALLSVALLIGRPAVLAVTVLYLVFAAGIASGGAERPGEPAAPWRLYAVAMGLLAPGVIADGLFVLPGVAVFAVAFVVHCVARAGHGVCRVGILSACGRRAHDARVGRTLEAAVLILAAGAVLAQPAPFAVAGWLVTAAAVAERPEPTTAPEAQPLAAAPAPVA